MIITRLLFVLLLVLLPTTSVWAAQGLTAFTVTPGANGGETYTVTIQILAMMTVLSLLPAALIMTTSFTRIIIVLSILRQALGTAQTPSNQILLGLALFLTFFIMAPVFNTAYNTGVKPYLDDQISSEVAFEREHPNLFMISCLIKHAKQIWLCSQKFLVRDNLTLRQECRSHYCYLHLLPVN